jgi:hypothetical protein
MPAHEQLHLRVPGSKSTAIPAADRPSEHLGAHPTNQAALRRALAIKNMYRSDSNSRLYFPAGLGYCITWQISKPIDGSCPY